MTIFFIIAFILFIIAVLLTIFLLLPPSGSKATTETTINKVVRINTIGSNESSVAGALSLNDVPPNYTNSVGKLINASHAKFGDKNVISDGNGGLMCQFPFYGYNCERQFHDISYKVVGKMSVDISDDNTKLTEITHQPNNVEDTVTFSRGNTDNPTVLPNSCSELCNNSTTTCIGFWFDSGEDNSGPVCKLYSDISINLDDIDIHTIYGDNSKETGKGTLYVKMPLVEPVATSTTNDPTPTQPNGNLKITDTVYLSTVGNITSLGNYWLTDNKTFINTDKFSTNVTSGKLTKTYTHFINSTNSTIYVCEAENSDTTDSGACKSLTPSYPAVFNEISPDISTSGKYLIFV